MKVLSLFSGAGGMDLGMEGNFLIPKSLIDPNNNSNWIEKETSNYYLLKPTGFETVFANDIRTDAMTAWTNYFGKKRDISGIFHLDSIVDLVEREISGEIIFPKDIDIITGGFPCNDFSVSGKRRGFNSVIDHEGRRISPQKNISVNRGELYKWMRRVIEIVKPKMFIAENVKGLTNLGDTLQIIQNDFSSADGNGYLIVPAQIIKAWQYGVPQSRERIFFIGFNKSALKESALNNLSLTNIEEKYNPYPNTTHGEGKLPPVSCRTVLSDLLEPDVATDPAQKTFSKARFMGKHCQGQSEIKLDKCGPTIRAEHHGNIEFRRLSREHGGKHQDELDRGLPERRLTVRECARIQTFPDDYDFIIKRTKNNPGVSGSNAYKLIGNAVPPLMAYHIAQNLQNKWNLYFK